MTKARVNSYDFVSTGYVSILSGDGSFTMRDEAIALHNFIETGSKSHCLPSLCRC